MRNTGFLATLLLALLVGAASASAQGAEADIDRPFVIKTFPADGDTDIPVNVQIKVHFNKQMDYLTFTKASVMLADEVGGAADGVVSYDSRSYVLTFTPAANLARGGRHTLFIPAYLVRDTAGNAPLENITFSFTTAEDKSDVPKLYASRETPAVARHSPDVNAADVPCDATIVFSMTLPLAADSVRPDCVTLNDGTSDRPCRVYYSERDREIIAVPERRLDPGLVYTVVLKNNFRTQLGHAMAANYVFSFSTKSAKDETPPLVVETSPIAGGRNVSVNTRIVATLSEPMDPLSLNPKTFLVLEGDRPVEGRVMFDLRTRKVMFAPLERLKPGAKYTCLLTTKARDTAGNFLAAPVEWTFETRVEKPALKPAVVKCSPADGSRDVPLDAKILVYFNKPMNESTLNALTVTLSDPRGPVPVATAFAKGANYVTVLPKRELAWATAYRVRVDPDVACLDGLRLGREFVFGFATAPEPDRVPPMIAGVAPAEDAAAVPVTTKVEARLSEPVNPETVDERTLVLRDPSGTTVDGRLEYMPAGPLLLFTPKGPLEHGKVYTAEIKDTLKDPAGNRMRSAKLWKFTTAEPPDITPPVVVSTRPFEGEKKVSPSAVIKVFFSERISPEAARQKAVQVYDDANNALHGRLVYDDALKCLVFSPEKNFKYGAEHTISVSKAVRDLAGNGLKESLLVHFTVEPAPDLVRPEFVGSEPKAGAERVPVDAPVRLSFSEPLDPVTVNADSVTLETDAGKRIPCRVDLSDRGVVSLTPLERMPFSAEMRATASRTLADRAGNRLAATVVVPFTTRETPDAKPPALISSIPAHGARGVAVHADCRLVFDEPLADAGLDERSVSLIPARLDDNKPVPVKISYMDGRNTLVVAPAVKLDYETDYRLVAGPVSDKAGNRAAAPVTLLFRTEEAPDRVPPRVVSSNPSNSRQVIAHTEALSVTFSEPLALSTVNAANVDLRDLNGTLPADVVWEAARLKIRLVPDGGLKPGREYFLYVGPGVTDLAGNPLAEPLSLHFETRPVEDTERPRIARVSPGNGATRVPERVTIVAEADEPLDPATVNRHTVILEEEGHPREVAVVCPKDSGRIEITPAEPLRRGFGYRVTLTAGILDRAGNALEKPVSWAFCCGVTEGERALDIALVAPQENDRGVAPDASVRVRFNAELDPGSVNAWTVLLTRDGRRVPASLALVNGGREVVLTPSKPLEPRVRYTARVTEGLRNRAGGPLRGAREWTFETAPGKVVVKP